MEKHRGKANKPGFFVSLRWNLGEIVGQILVIPIVAVSAYIGLSKDSWLVFFALVVPLLAILTLIAKKLSGKNPYRHSQTNTPK